MMKRGHMKISVDMVEAAIKAYATKRHPVRWDGEPWGLAGIENHRRAITAALRAALKTVERRKTQQAKHEIGHDPLCFHECPECGSRCNCSSQPCSCCPTA